MAPRKHDRPSSTRTTGPTSAQKRLAAERAAAARARIADSQRRRRFYVVGGAVLGVVIIVAVLVIVKLVTGAGGAKSGTKATAASPAVLAKVLHVPASALNQVGTGSAQPPSPISGTPTTVGGKPYVLYVGAEYCPYCAAERWGMVVALSRFGTFTGLGETESSPNDVYPSTQTLTFHGAHFTSNYLTFVGREVESNQVHGNSYAPLDRLTAQEQSIVAKYNAPPYVRSAGSIPFVYLGGKYVISGASYDPGVLKGKTHQQIADALAQPSSPIAKGVLGTANLITAAICTTTNQQPGAVCSSAGVRAAASTLNQSGSTG